MNRVVYSFVEDLGMQYLVYENKFDALSKVAEHFKDTRTNCVIPYELEENDKLIIDQEGFEALKQSWKYFQDNPSYKNEVSETEAIVHQKEFE